MAITWAILGVAIITGLLGGVHCAGMCGGIVSALASGPTKTRKPWLIHLCYNLGRITSYATAGAIAGTVGSLGLMLDGLLPVQIALYAAANLLLIGLGLYLAGIRGPVAHLERLGSRFWSLLRPFTRRFLPADSPAKALALGMLWGWLPCGLVYTMLFTALLSGSTLGGATVMLAFGLGTLPNLMAAAALLHGPRAWLASRPARTLSGAVVLGFGVYGLAHAATLSQQIKGGLFCIG
jgi:sulfite exporter TauE/SafE